MNGPSEGRGAGRKRPCRGEHRKATAAETEICATIDPRARSL